MDVEGFVADEADTLLATVGEDVTLGLNKERDMIWITQNHGQADDVVIVHINDAPELIRKLQAWVDAQ